MACLVTTLAWGSVWGNPPENPLGGVELRVKEMRLQGKGPWLHALGDSDEVLGILLDFMASRCFVHKNQQSTAGGYLAASTYFHKVCTR